MTSAEVTLDVEYGTPTQHHNPIELFTTTCVWNNDELTVYEPNEFVFGLKNNVAQKLNIPAESESSEPLRGRGLWLEIPTVAPHSVSSLHAARKLNRPVKLVATRDQGFTI